MQVQLAIVEMRHVTRVPDCPKPSAVSTLAACVLQCLAWPPEGLQVKCDWTVHAILGRPSLAQVPEGPGGSAGLDPVLVASARPFCIYAPRVLQ